eukprot:4315647-Alexandrium_andersonii.AAC.1
MAVEASEKVGSHLQIIIGQELTEEFVNAYDRYAHQHIFPPANKEELRAVVGDGHKKIFTACSTAPA